MPDESDPIPQPFRPQGDGLDITPFHTLIKQLRHPEDGCPWDKAQTLHAMGKTLVNEAEEAAEALASADHAHQCEELGDVLLNIMLAVVIAEEQCVFTWKDVVQGVTEKLIRRHPTSLPDKKRKPPSRRLPCFSMPKPRKKAAVEKCFSFAHNPIVPFTPITERKRHVRHA